MPVDRVGRQVPEPRAAYGDEVTRGARAFRKWRETGSLPKLTYKPDPEGTSWPKGRKLTEEEFMAAAPKRESFSKPAPSNAGWGWAGGGATGNEALRKGEEKSRAKVGPPGPKIYVRNGKVEMLSAAEVEEGLRQTAVMMGSRGMALDDAAKEFARHGYDFSRYRKDYAKGAAGAPAAPTS